MHTKQMKLKSLCVGPVKLLEFEYMLKFSSSVVRFDVLSLRIKKIVNGAQSIPLTNIKCIYINIIVYI